MSKRVLLLFLPLTVFLILLLTGTATGDHLATGNVTGTPPSPIADAGEDIEDVTWDGSPVVLHGDGQGIGTLRYRWDITTPAYGSTLTGTLGETAVLTFTPDVPGEWELELTVTDDTGGNGSDRVHLRLLTIPTDHPRIYLISYHQHYDQNSFTLFKYDDLAVDSGVYSGDGLFGSVPGQLR